MLINAQLSSGGRGRKFESSHPDQNFFIELASCCLLGRYHELTISPLPEFCRTPLTGKLPASTIINPCCACDLGWLAHEHCLGSAGPANFHQSPDKPLIKRRRPLSEYNSDWCVFFRCNGKFDFSEVTEPLQDRCSSCTLMAGPSICLGQMKSDTEAVFCLKVGDSPAENA